MTEPQPAALTLRGMLWQTVVVKGVAYDVRWLADEQRFDVIDSGRVVGSVSRVAGDRYAWTAEDDRRGVEHTRERAIRQMVRDA